MVQTADQTSTAKDVPSCGQKSGGPAKGRAGAPNYSPPARTITRLACASGFNPYKMGPNNVFEPIGGDKSERVG